LQPGSRIGLLGHNGAGKSTFIKLLAGELSPQAGKAETSSELKTGYFAQHQLEQLHPEDTPLEHFQRLDKRATEQSLRDHLGGFGLSGDKVESKISPFSGGEKARLVFATLVYQKPNLLLLDEPTNHLDLNMRHAISMALQEFEGAMVIVSHDRHLLRSVTDEFYLVADSRVEPFKGDLEDYRQWTVDQRKENELTEANDNSRQTVSKKDQKRLNAEKRNQLRPLKNKLSRLEKELEQLTDKKQQLETALANPRVYEVPSKEHLKELLIQQSENVQLLEAVEEQWMQISEELENII